MAARHPTLDDRRVVLPVDRHYARRQWAYVELGWEGIGAGSDRVENASLMPWLVATAYLHSVMIEEKKQSCAYGTC